MTNEVIRARMDDHCELEGDKVLHERKLTSIDWQYIFSHRFLTFSKIMKACNGKGSCVLYASNDVYGNPCPVYASKYIYIKYKCE